MNKIIFFIMLSLFTTTAFADWTIETFTHAATQTQSQSAMVRNDDGFELAIFKTSEGIVWLDFSLSDNSFDELSQNQLPLFQIDDQKPVQMLRGFVATIVPADEGIEAIIVDDDQSISTARDFSVDHIIAERLPERVICPIWQGESRPHLGTIDALANGQQITFDFVLLDGTKQQTVFTLKGAKQALEGTIFK
ncbi:MAG: hypothetical protein DRQ35_04395 [Gammaproteobacteria bacterium]|nr:MAG: hypothetical protein DRQ35_04395 [Gammaproteobacteria bacterium]